MAAKIFGALCGVLFVIAGINAVASLSRQLCPTTQPGGHDDGE